MAWNGRNGASNGARSKTFRNESSNTKKNNRNFSESSDDSNWNRPKPLSTYASSGIWDDDPNDLAPKNNAWNENLTSKWSENQRSNTSAEPKKQNGGWNSIDTEFPALESRPEPPPVNVWEVRKKKANQKKALEPSNETDEERMYREAIELSKMEVERDEIKRKELEEEYYMQKHLLATDPSLYSEFYTDEELAALFPAKEEEKSKYEAKYQNSFSEEEYHNQNLQHKGSSKSNQSESYDNRNAQLPSARTTDSKEKISKAVDMFGGWGNTQRNSQSVNKSNNSAKMPPKGNTTKHRKELVFDNQEHKKGKERQRDDDCAWNTNNQDPSSRSASSKTRSLRKREDDAWETDETNLVNEDEEETDKDWAWRTDDSETNRKSDSSKTHTLRKSKDEDDAWKTDDPDPYCENYLNATDKVLAWKTEDPEPVSVSISSKTHRKCDDEDEDYAWKTDDPKPNSRPEANSYSEKAEIDQDLAWKTEDSKTNTYSSKKSEDKDTDDDYAWKSDDPKPNSRLETSSFKERLEPDQDGAWKAEDSVPKNARNSSMKSSLSKTHNSSWETKGDSSLQGSVSKSKKIEARENEAWESNNPIPSGRVKSRDTSRGITSKSKDVSSSYKSSLTETNDNLNSKVTDSISNETLSSQYLNSSLISEEKISSGRNHNPTASGNLADSIASDYVNLASSRKVDDQNLSFSNASEPSPKKSVFELLKNDYGKHFVLDSEEVKTSKDEPKIDAISFLAPYAPEKTPGHPSESLSIAGGFDAFHNSNKKEESLSDIISSNSIQPDDDISLPLFATSYNEADQGNSSKISVSDEFRQSFGAHFQQFQSISTITPVYMMNPYMMAGMSPMGMMPQMGMTPMMQPMGMNPMMPQMGMNPMMPQMSMNPMMPQMGMTPMVQPNPMVSPMGMNPVMQHMSIYQQMIGNSMLPQSTLPGSSTEGSLDLNQFIPPPTDRSGLNQTNGLSDPPQMQPTSAAIEAPSTYGQDEWLEQFLSKPVFNEEPAISAPTMPQSSYPRLESSDAIGSSPIPAPRGADEFARSAQVRGHEDEMLKSMRNSSRYVSEKQTEVRQPASMPSWGRAKQ